MVSPTTIADTRRILESWGTSQGDSTLYLHIFEFGPQSPETISQQCGLSRAVVKHIIDRPESLCTLYPDGLVHIQTIADISDARCKR